MLIGTSIELRDVDGEGIEEPCLSIPLRRNGIRPHRTRGVIMRLTLTRRKSPTPRGSQYYLSVYPPPDVETEIEELGYSDRLRSVGFGYDMNDRFFKYITRKTKQKK